MATFGVIDSFFVYQFIKRLVKPFNKWKAYKTGVINANGDIIVPEKDRTPEQKKSFKYFDLMMLNLKKLLGKVPGGSSKLASYAAALWLIREMKEGTDSLDMLTEENLKKVIKEEIANSANPAHIAGLDNPPKFMGKRVFDVSRDTMARCRMGKKKGDRYKKYLDCDENWEEIRSYARNNPKEDIILRNNGEMMFLRRSHSGRGINESVEVLEEATFKFSRTGTPVTRVFNSAQIFRELDKSSYKELRYVATKDKMYVWDSNYHIHSEYFIDKYGLNLDKPGLPKIVGLGYVSAGYIEKMQDKFKITDNNYFGPNNVKPRNNPVIKKVIQGNNDLVLEEREYLSEEVTRSQLNQIERYLDAVFAKIGMDVEFTRHFLDRVNDPRNKKQITVNELVALFQKEYERYGKTIAQMGPDKEAVLTDLSSDINTPIVLKWNRQKNELEMVAKTIMRKSNFRPNDNREKQFKVR